MEEQLCPGLRGRVRWAGAGAECGLLVAGAATEDAGLWRCEVGSLTSTAPRWARTGQIDIAVVAAQTSNPGPDTARQVGIVSYQPLHTLNQSTMFKLL